MCLKLQLQGQVQTAVVELGSGVDARPACELQSALDGGDFGDREESSFW